MTKEAVTKKAPAQEPAAEAPSVPESSKSSRFALRLPQKWPKHLSKPLLLGTTLLVGTGAIAYLNFVQRAPRSLSPAGAQLVPQTALATMTVTTDELTWTKLRQFGTADTQQQFDAMLSEWKTRLFTENGYSFKRDIKPWIGDRITLAMLPAKAAEDSDTLGGGGLATATQHLVLVVPIDDALKARSLLEAGPKRTEVTWESRSYKGVDVQTILTASGETFESAVIGTSWLLLSNTADGLEQAIDTHKGGGRSLLDVAGYRKAATRVESPLPPGKNFAQFYLNLPLATKVLEPPAGATAAQPGSLLPLQGSQGIVATALVESEGIRFQGTSWLSPKNDLAYSNLSNEAGEMPRRLPSDTLLMMSGSNLQQAWQAFSEGNTSPPFFPNPQNLRAGLLTQTGLDLDEDIMPWAAGEFALGLIPPVSDSEAEEAPDAGNSANSENADGSDELAEDAVIESAPLMVMVKTNDRALAESAWTQLDDVMTSRYRFQVETREFNGGSVTEWISPFQGVQFSHGWLPGDVTFFVVGEGAAEAIAPNPERALSETRTFQTLTSEAETPNNGHFYIDLAQINALQGSVFPLPQLSEDGTTAAIQAVGLTTSVGDRTMDYDLYVKLVKGGKPGSL